MKRIVTLILCVLLLLLFGVNCFAASTRIINEDGILTSDEEKKLGELSESVSEAYGVDIIIVLEADEPYDSEEKANYFYDKGSYSDNAVVFYFSDEYNDWYVLTVGDCEDIITDSRIDDIIDEIADDLRADNFYDAFAVFIERNEHYIESKVDETVADKLLGFVPKLLFVVAVSFIIALVIVYIEKKKMNNAVLQENANQYVIEGSVDINLRSDAFLTSTITRVPLSSGNSGGRSGGGGGSRGGHGGRL